MSNFPNGRVMANAINLAAREAAGGKGTLDVKRNVDQTYYDRFPCRIFSEPERPLLLLAAATVQTGGIRWRRNGTACLVVDGVGAATQWVALKTGSTTSYSGMDITTEVLGTTALELALAMSTRPLPEEIREAIRLMSRQGWNAPTRPRSG